MEQNQITRTMAIEEIFAKFPDKSQKLAQELTNTGLNCVGCQASTWETLETGMLKHGYAEEEIDELIVRLNQILAQKSDPKTITMTKRAAEKLQQILESEGKKGWGLRFGYQAGGCSGFEYLLDYSEKVEKGDQVFHSHGIEIHVFSDMVPRLIGSEIDYLDGLHGSGFKISNPQAKSSCGCGKSQSY
jgi:iron-sulfur cluster assembly protein